MFFIFSIKMSYSQNINAISIQPEISIDYMLNNKLGFNVNNYWLSNNIEAFHPEGELNLHSESQHTITATYSLNKNIDICGAYELNIDYIDGAVSEYTNRSIEALQYSITPGKLKIAQRLQFEQHYNSNTVFRNRYRLSLKYPLCQNSNGINKLSLVVSEELLWSLSKETPGKLNQRFIVALKYDCNKFISSEIGIQWRTKNIGDLNSKNILIGLITLGINLNEVF